MKIHAAYHAAVRHRGQPTVILAQTKKGYGMGTAGQGRMTTHQQKKLDAEALREFRDRFALPLSDAQVESVEFHKPAARQPRDEVPACAPRQARRLPAGAHLRVRGAADTGRRSVRALRARGRRQGDVDDDGVRPHARRAAEGRRRSAPRIVPIIADEARTFGMADLFRQVGIYSPLGQLYEPEDSAQISYYKEAKDGQILEEGINEAGAIASWVAAATSYSTHGLPMLPFYIFYSMFGFQRVGDLLWAAADSRARGFLLGATAGRTTLSGEGLQHQDGTSHLIASTVPNCRAYDPCFAYELAVIVEHGMRRMLTEQEDVFYYVTVMNENYAHPRWLEAAGASGRLRRRGDPARHVPRARFVARRGARAAARRRHDPARGARRGRTAGVGLRQSRADVYSVTSFTELRREAMALERAARLGEPRAASWIEQQLPATGAPVVAATDYVSSVPDLIRPWIGDRYVALGTDGFGRCDTRAALRAFFEVDRRSIALAALDAVDPALAARARDSWGLAAGVPPWAR